MPRKRSKGRFLVRILASLIAGILIFSLIPYMFQDHSTARAASSDSYSGKVTGHNTAIGGLNDSVTFDIEGAKFVKKTDYIKNGDPDATYYFEVETGQSIRINALAEPVEDPSYDGPEGVSWANGLQVNSGNLHNATLQIDRVYTEGENEESGTSLVYAEVKGNGTLQVDYTLSFTTNTRLWEIAWKYNLGKHSDVTIELHFSEPASTPGTHESGTILQIDAAVIAQNEQRHPPQLYLGGTGQPVDSFKGESIDNGDELYSGSAYVSIKIYNHQILLPPETSIKVKDLTTDPPTLEVGGDGHVYVTDIGNSGAIIHHVRLEGTGFEIGDFDTSFEMETNSTGLYVRTYTGTVQVFDTENLKTVYISANQMVTKLTGSVIGEPESFDPNQVNQWWSGHLSTVENPTPVQPTDNGASLNSNDLDVWQALFGDALAILIIFVILITCIVGAWLYHHNKSQEKTRQATPQLVKSGPLPCPFCGKTLTYVPQYQQWYCQTEQRYV